jgi:hypothetical protein
MTTQLEQQQNGLNKMTVDEYLKNRKAYNDRKALTGSGRGDARVARDARKRYKSDQIDILRNQYAESKPELSNAEAKQLAQETVERQMRSLAALHGPDQVAGGANVIVGFGDSQVNSTIGGQWAGNVKGQSVSRVQMLDNAANAVPIFERATTTMNVKLERCK